MSSFQGGVDPNAKVEILTSKRKSSHKKLSNLSPQDLLGQVGSRWYFAVSEVRTSKKRHTGYVVTLESGEKLLMAEGTITCGQFGPNLVEECEDELICFVIMNGFIDSTDSRRNFGVEFKGGAQHKKIISRLCKSSTDNEKKFYRFSEVLTFLARLVKDHPEIQIVPCLQVRSHYKSELYDFVSCVKPSHPFIPLIQMGDLSKGWNAKPVLPTVLAFCGSDHQIYSRKVVSCRKVASSGPWAMPIFNALDDDSPTRQRFSWNANHIPIFNEIASYVSEWAAELTQPNEGQELLPQPPPPVDYRFRGLSNSYDTLCSHYEGSENQEEDSEENLNILWGAIQKLARASTPESSIKNHLISQIQKTCDAAPSEK